MDLSLFSRSARRRAAAFRRFAGRRLVCRVLSHGEGVVVDLTFCRALLEGVVNQFDSIENQVIESEVGKSASVSGADLVRLAVLLSNLQVEVGRLVSVTTEANCISSVDLSSPVS